MGVHNNQTVIYFLYFRLNSTWREVLAGTRGVDQHISVKCGVEPFIGTVENTRIISTKTSTRVIYEHLRGTLWRSPIQCKCNFLTAVVQDFWKMSDQNCLAVPISQMCSSILILIHIMEACSRNPWGKHHVCPDQCWV